MRLSYVLGALVLASSTQAIVLPADGAGQPFQLEKRDACSNGVKVCQVAHGSTATLSYRRYYGYPHEGREVMRGEEPGQD